MLKENEERRIEEEAEKEEEEKADGATVVTIGKDP